MYVEIVGIKKIEYTSKRTGQLVRGIELQGLFSDEKVLGKAVDKFFCGSRVDLAGVSVGDYCNIYFDRYGHVDSVIPD